MGVSSTSPIHSLSIQEVAPNVPIEGPIAGLDEEIRALQQRAFQKNK